MRRRAAITQLHQMKEINVVPMIDVMMFLLVVFIMTMPLIENGIHVNLPKGRAQGLDQKKAKQVTVRLDGGIYLDRNLVSKDELSVQAKVLAAADPETTIIVRGDEGAPYGKIMEAMRILSDAGLTKLAMATAPEGPAARRR